ncbi:MAG: hypothetical protein ACRDJE_04235 [Dehalococcoidia bacterium]
MDLADWTDIALIVIAILYSVITAVVMAVAAVVWWYGRKGFKAVDRLIDQKVRPALDAVELQLLAIRDQTARLPGNQAIGLGEAPARKGRGLPLPLPFRRKRRRFPFLPS